MSCNGQSTTVKLLCSILNYHRYIGRLVRWVRFIIWKDDVDICVQKQRYQRHKTYLTFNIMIIVTVTRIVSYRIVSYRKLYLVGKITFPCPLNPVYRPHGSGGAARLSGPNLARMVRSCCCSPNEVHRPQTVMYQHCLWSAASVFTYLDVEG